jgi:hypothetical protein
VVALILTLALAGWHSDVAWISAGMTADLVSTEMALQHCASCAEANPLGQSVDRRVVLKVAGTAVTGLACHKLRKDGHSRAATTLRWVTTGLLLGVAAHNLHVMRQ